MCKNSNISAIKMKLVQVFVPMCIACLVLFSCNQTEQTNQHNPEIQLDAVINSQSKDPNAKGDNKCLLAYQEKYDALLSETDVLNATGFSKEVLKTKYNTLLKNKEYHEFVYAFKNDRMSSVPGFNTEMSVSDLINLRAIQPMSMQSFQQKYQAVTDEQMRLANEAIDEITEGNVKNEDADKALKQAQEQGVDKEQIRKTGGMLTNAFKEVSKGYRTVEGVGDAASWNVFTNELHVLQKGVKFEVRVDISNDKERNKSVAIELANIILKKCP